MTANYVLPIWDQSVTLSTEDSPRKILAVAEGVLKSIENPSKADERHSQEFYYLMDTEAFVVTYSAWRALGAAYSALGMSLSASPFYKARDIEKNKLVLVDHDAAHDAVIAYSVIDDSEPGAWREKYVRQEKWALWY